MPWPNPEPLDGSPPPSASLDSVVLRRGSTRLMDPSAQVSGEVYLFSLAAATRGIDIPHFIAVHAVTGIAPGLYQWPEPQPVRSGNLREELLKVCWYQDLGRDAAFDVIGAVDLAGVTNRGYREAQVAAGIVEGRLHLAAYALGTGASGMTFLDTEIEPLLGPARRPAHHLHRSSHLPQHRRRASSPTGRGRHTGSDRDSSDPASRRRLTPRSSTHDRRRDALSRPARLADRRGRPRCDAFGSRRSRTDPVTPFGSALGRKRFDGPRGAGTSKS